MVFDGEDLEGNDESVFGGDDVRSPAPAGQLEKDRKMRREIANSNERRRMQSINAGFQMLRSLLPPATTSIGNSSGSGAEKLSKATILQQACIYIKKLDDEKRHLAARNEELQRALTTTVKAAAAVSSQQPRQEIQVATAHQSAAKRKKRDTECSDEGIAMAYSAPPSCPDDVPSPATPVADELRRELLDLRAALDTERQRSGTLERSCALLQERLQQALLAATATVPPPLQMTAAACSATAVPIAGQRYQAATGEFCPAETACRSPDGAACGLALQPSPVVDLRPTSMSRRNLQMIVEAIHHLEGGSGDVEGDTAAASPAGVEDSRSSCDSRDCGASATSVEASKLTVRSDCGLAGAASAATPASGQQQHLYYRPTFMAQVPCVLERRGPVSRR